MGDVPIVRQSLDDDSKLNINCVDYMGRSALHLAVDSENLEGIELLLDRVNFHAIEEALLHAISKVRYNILRSEAVLFKVFSEVEPYAAILIPYGSHVFGGTLEARRAEIRSRRPREERGSLLRGSKPPPQQLRGLFYYLNTIEIDDS